MRAVYQSSVAVLFAFAVGCGSSGTPGPGEGGGGAPGSAGTSPGTSGASGSLGNAAGSPASAGSVGAGAGATGLGGSGGALGTLGGNGGAVSATAGTSGQGGVSGSSGGTVGGSGGMPGQRTTYQNQQAFVDLRYGMFIHFNMGTFTDEEWAKPNYPPATFAPKDVDTDQWASAAKAAGMKFAVLTTKHHDGFALWPTKVSNYNVMNSAYKVDIVKKFVDSFRKAGVIPCLYFSIWDRTRGIDDTSVTKADLDFIVAQLTELLGGTYGEIPLIMFDGWTWKMGRNKVPYQLIRETVKSLQPNILMVDHNGLTQAFEEDILNFEHFAVPPDNKLATTRGNPIMPKWFWHPGYDTMNPMSTATILSRLKDAEAHWCNFLLDCPPNRDGVLDTNVVNRLADAGKQWAIDSARPALPAQPIQLEHPVTPVSATASSNAATVSNAIDGMNDYVSGKTVQSLWTSGATLPQSVTMDLGSVYKDLDYFSYMPRQDHVTDGQVTSAYVTTGNITSYNLYSSTDGTTFTKFATGTWVADGLIKRLKFPAVSARYVRLEATAINGSGGAVISEIDTGAVDKKPTVVN
jgi:alpha-L-fucosidase